MLLQLKNDRVLDDGRRAYAKIGRIFPNPFLGDATAFIGARHVLTDRHRHAAVSCADERIAHEAVHRTDEALDLALASFQKVDQPFRPGPENVLITACMTSSQVFLRGQERTPFPPIGQRGLPACTG